MKRLSFALIAVMSATIAFGSEPVPSVNVVGYAKVPQAPGLDLKSCIFYVMEGSNTLSEILGTNGVANANSALADNVYIFTPGSGPDGGYKNYWLFDNSEGAEFNRKWVDGYQVAKEVIMPGQGFWVRNRSTTTNYYTHLGEAELDDTVTMMIQPGLQILAYPYSCDVEIGKLACTNGVANSNSALADNIYVYTPGVGYRTYWLFDNAEGPAYYRKWVDGAQVATDVIKAGQGFWYRSRSTGNVTWIEKRPYLND